MFQKLGNLSKPPKRMSRIIKALKRVLKYQSDRSATCKTRLLTEGGSRMIEHSCHRTFLRIAGGRDAAGGGIASMTDTLPSKQ